MTLFAENTKAPARTRIADIEKNLFTDTFGCYHHAIEMSFRWRAAPRILFVLPLVFSPAFLHRTHGNLRSGTAERLRLLCCASKRQLLHDRHVLSWQELLVGIEQGQIHSIFILCGATAGNLGAILRTSTLLDISAVCILGSTSKATLDKAFRFSMLEQKNHWDTLVVPAPLGEASGEVETVETPSLLDLKQKGVKLVGMVARDAAKESPSYDLWDLDLSRPLAFVFGADEEDGSAFTKAIEVQDLDLLATVPMKDFGHQGVPDTLNLSACAAIVAYERRRQCQQCQRRWWQRLKRWMW